MMRVWTSLTFVALLALSAFAQDEERDRSKPVEISITGCITKADAGDGWQLTDNESGAKTMVLGAADVGKHENHTVKATGTPSDDGQDLQRY